MNGSRWKRRRKLRTARESLATVAVAVAVLQRRTVVEVTRRSASMSQTITLLYDNSLTFADDRD